MPSTRETLPGFPNCMVLERQGQHVLCAYHLQPPVCPECGQVASRNGQLTREIHDLPRAGQPQLLWVEAARWKWPCKCTEAQALGVRNVRRQSSAFAGLVNPRAGEGRERQVTARLHAYLLEAWARGESVRSLAQQTGLGEDHTYRLIQEHLPTLRTRSRYVVAMRRPQLIGIDEIFWRGHAITVVVDLAPARPETPAPYQTARVIDILPSRSPAALDTFFRELRALMHEAGADDWQPVIASDMWGDFRTVIRRVFAGQALHVADRFHVVAKIIEDLEDAAERQHLRLYAPNKAYARAADRAAARESMPAVRAAYHQALGRAAPAGAAAPGTLDPSIQALARLAADLHVLWKDGETSRSLISAFRQWRLRVDAWVRETQGPVLDERAVHPFGRLIQLLDHQGWLVEVTNARRPEARLPPGPGGQDRWASTGRVEGFNRVIGQLEQRSPNHPRNPRVGQNWRRWNEEAQFRRYRERLLFTLNVPLASPGRLESQAEPARPRCQCGASLDGVPVTARRQRHAWDLPLAGQRVRLSWTEGLVRCPAPGCQQTTLLTRPADQGVTPALRAYLLEALQGDQTVHQLHRQTGASPALLSALEAELPDPEPSPLPARVGALVFRCQRRDRLLLTDVSTGQPLDLLSRNEGHFTAGDLHDWLRSPAAAQVQQVWVESPEWLSAPPLPGITFMLDRFAASRLIQRAVQALQRDHAFTIPVSAQRTPVLKGFRAVITRAPEKSAWPMIDQMHWDERQALRQTLLEAPGLQFGLTQIQELKRVLRETPTEEAVMEWLTALDRHVQHARAAAGRQAASIDQARRALLLITQPLEHQETRRAIVEGARLAATDALGLAASRRRLQDLTSSRVFRGKGEAAWKRLRRVAITRVGRG